MKGKYLITTDAWFVAPDGMQYNAVWGETEIVSDAVLGIKTNRQSTNWFAKVGNEKSHIIISGCQVNYAIKCDEKPDTEDKMEYKSSAEHGKNEFFVNTHIYIP